MSLIYFIFGFSSFNIAWSYINHVCYEVAMRFSEEESSFAYIFINCT